MTLSIGNQGTDEYYIKSDKTVNIKNSFYIAHRSKPKEYYVKLNLIINKKIRLRYLVVKDNMMSRSVRPQAEQNADLVVKDNMISRSVRPEAEQNADL